MNRLLLIFSLVSVLNSVVGAPAVSSVHVSFRAGNKATQYSHGSLADGSIVQYNVVGNMGDHTVRKRSATRRPPREPGRLSRLTLRTSTTSTTIPTVLQTTTEVLSDNTLKPAGLRNKKAFQLKGRKRVQFVPMTIDDKRKSIVASSEKASVTMTTVKSLESTDDDSTVKPKDSKAVKRSPYVSENFVGSFNFPDFDEFGGNDFGSLTHFAPANTAPAHQTGHASMNAESLAPDGVFLPPIPTQASNYIENDPYLADPDTAKYASQHPPYFHEFPHKRTVLSLNERREENGLEPNILRSIRPFFAFFEINKRR